MGWGSILGAIGAPFTGGASLLIGAAADLGGAAIASRGAKKAAKTQVAAAEKAQGIHRDVYDRTTANYEPYRAAGTAAVPNLASLLSRERPSFGAPGVPPVMPGGPPAGGLASLSRGGVDGGASGAEMVTVEAPDGERRQVPPQMAQALVSRGARIVG